MIVPPLMSATLVIIRVLELLQITGPDKQVIEVNPAAIVDLRVPRSAEHFAQGAKCLVFTADGKYLVVIQTCESIKKTLQSK